MLRCARPGRRSVVAVTVAVSLGAVLSASASAAASPSGTRAPRPTSTTTTRPPSTSTTTTPRGAARHGPRSSTTATPGGCEAFPRERAGTHDEAIRREKTLDELMASLRRAPDPVGLNGGQLAALASARAGVARLDQAITTACDAPRSQLTQDAAALVGYRVYWLRVPQTRLIEAYDRLVVARARIDDVLGRLDPRRSSRQEALASARQQLAAAGAVLGTSGPAAAITTVAGLRPAAAMSGDEAAMRAARHDLDRAWEALSRAVGDVRRHRGR